MRVIDLPFAYGVPPATGRLRAAPEDFQVEEDLGFEPEGEGEHLWLWVEKCGINTDQVARSLARLAQVRPRDVSFAGLKDRHALTRQWFSIHLPKGDLGADAYQDRQWRTLRMARARRKIRRGSLRGNRFIISLRDVCGNRQHVEESLAYVAAGGVPNYFGEQRFGHDNLAQAEAMARGELSVPDRHLRGIFLSSMRSALFNAVLARRVADRTWDQGLPGEAFNLDGSRSYFVADAIDEVLLGRLARGDVHPTGPLWGRGESPCHSDALAVEQAVVFSCPEIWRAACDAAKMEQERRPLRLMPKQLTWQWCENDVLQLSFGLSAGSYATVVIREVININI